MPDPISPEDIYGASQQPVPEGTPAMGAQTGQPPVTVPLPVEETPEIAAEPSPEPVPAPVPANVPPPAPQKSSSILPTLGALILFAGLFGLGVWLSSFIRQYFPGGLVGLTPQQQEVAGGPTPTPTPMDPLAGWKTYQVESSTTKLPIDGISYKLPAEALAPTCDTTTCISQGTYLPGGTRFTVAPRGTGQLLTDFRGSSISDVGGTVFTATDATVSGHKGKLFTGLFDGKTVGGFGFSQMRGYMIEVTPTLSLEVNHFTPTGISANFIQDDALFDQIILTLVLPGTPSATPTVTPIVTPITTIDTTSSASPARAY